jgi:hypothetical protein
MESGELSTLSVKSYNGKGEKGVITRAPGRISRVELVEVSIVPRPSQPRAVFAVVEGKARPIVARILSERANGATCAVIADNLNGAGIPTATALRGERRGLIAGAGKWHAATVAAICRNQVILRLAEAYK